MKTNMNLTQKLISNHLVNGDMKPGKEIEIRMDQILQQDATGTLVMLELEAMGLDRVKTEVAVQYVDHNLLQTDHKNADDHLFLQSAAKKFGYWFSRPGNGISHVVHMEHFGIPGKTLIGSDSHTCSAGGMGMLAIGGGGLDIAAVAAGRPFHLKMPEVMGVELTGKLPEWVSAKDIILEMLRRHDVNGGVGYIIEYHGDGLGQLSAWDRHVIANMGAELGATTSVFPSDERTRQFMAQQGREGDWKELAGDPGAAYDRDEHIHLDDLVPLIAKPSSPGNVVPVSEVEGKEISQAVVGSSANPGLRDFWIAGGILQRKVVPPEVSMDINPSSRGKIEDLGKMGMIPAFMEAGARFHQTGCMGCIGMGQAPSSGTISLRTMPRNFPGRSGTKGDQVYLCSPETAVVSALQGKITDPRSMAEEKAYPRFEEPEHASGSDLLLIAPNGTGGEAKLKKGPNIKTLPAFDPMPDSFEVPVLLAMGDHVSTDEILPAGAEVLPLRSNIEAISKYCYRDLSADFYEKSRNAGESHGGHVVVAGRNYAQGSSREHAAMAPRYLGQRAVLAVSYARIGFQNLINFGIIPFLFEDPQDLQKIKEGDVLSFSNLRQAVKEENPLEVENPSGSGFMVRTSLTAHQREVLLAGGLINLLKQTV